MAARYYVKESTGYSIGLGGPTHRPLTEVLLLDRDYCHRAVWTSLRTGAHNYTLRLPALRDEAQRLCREWNAEDRAGGEDYAERAYGVSYER